MTLAPLIKVLLTTALIGNEFNSIIKNFSLQRAKQSDGHEYTSTLALNQYSTFWGLMDNDKDNNGNATFNKLEVLLSDLKLQKSAGLLVKNVLAQNNVSDGVIGFVETVGHYLYIRIINVIDLLDFNVRLLPFILDSVLICC